MGLLKMLGFNRAPQPTTNELLQNITKRAERLGPQERTRTFVAVGGLEHALLNADNRIMFGRRGTGKTHILSFVAESATLRGDIAVQMDLRSIGSHSYLYMDDGIPVSERVTRLLRDFVTALHDRILDRITEPGSRHKPHYLAETLDQVGASVADIIVRDTVETTSGNQGSTETSVGGEVKGRAHALSSFVEGSAKAEAKRSGGNSSEIKETGHVRLSVNIGRVHNALNNFATRCDCRIWILIDEWGSLPRVLQPHLADFLKRCFFPISNYTIHIAAIEQRSSFRIGDGAETIGIELGSDASADIHLDDYLVFENSPQRSIAFFKEMLFRHLKSAAGEHNIDIKNSDQFVASIFTQLPTFRELVRASEGVPRDALYILQFAASRAQEEKISIPHVRAAAKDWYDRDKASYLTSNADADAMMQWIINNVIGKRRAKAFLVAANTRNDILDRLFDERILHIAKRSYSAKYDPTKRYKIWKIDYGCYVDRVNTSQAPTGFLFENQDVMDEDFIVPEDDNRAIRHAVLDIEEFSLKEVAQDHLPLL